MPTNDSMDSSPPSPPGEENIETTFQRLRRDGHSRMETVQKILDALDVSLREAKQVLLTSDTWAEAREETDTTPDPPASNGPPPAPG